MGWLLTEGANSVYNGEKTLGAVPQNISKAGNYSSWPASSVAGISVSERIKLVSFFSLGVSGVPFLIFDKICIICIFVVAISVQQMY